MKSTTYKVLQERIKEIEGIIATRPDDEQLISFVKSLKEKKQPYSLSDEKLEIEQDFLEEYLPTILYCEYANDFKDEYYWKYLKKFGVKDSIEFINFVRDKFVNFIKRCRRYYKK